MLPIAIIGAGLIGPRHAQCIQDNAETTLVAIIDPSPSALQIANSFNVPHFPSIPSMFATLPKESHPTAAIICTPNHTHVPVTKELLEYGILNILLEKPVSDSLVSAQDLLHALSSNPDYTHVKILVGHHRRFNPYVLTTKSLLDASALGTPIAVNGLWTLLKPDSYFAPPSGTWRTEKGKGGVLGINLIHDVDLMQFFFGDIVRVFAEPIVPQRNGKKGDGDEGSTTRHTAEEGAAITLRFASGVVGTFLICDATPSPLNFETGTRENPLIAGVDPGESASDCYRIFGGKGSLSVPDMTRWSYDKKEIVGWNGELGVEKVGVEGRDVRPLDRQLEHFVRVVKGEEEVGCSVEDGVRALRVVGGVREAMETGRVVDIS
ncbi:hypothetical protein BDW59DRAFT_159715 [Aspergillus cavernicola]|uniref:Quinate utilization oxidoreductase QutH n=1 Tax=Aspergillus cavernicola TaxID=176166 RepID=A0ABR4IL58_9EURO